MFLRKTVHILKNAGIGSSNDKRQKFCINKHVFFYCQNQPVYTAVCIYILNGQYKNINRNLVEQYFRNTDGNNIALS